MRKLRILVLVHKDLSPPDSLSRDFDWTNCPFVTEYYVVSTLRKMGHEVHVLGVISDLAKIREAVEEVKPHIAFNLLEEFHQEALFDQNVVSYLELLRVPYTGCNPRGLILGRDKAITKKILAYHRIKVPKFSVFRRNQPIKKPKNMDYPIIVKCLEEEASLGITQSSVVRSEEKLLERVDYIHTKLGTHAIAEQFIAGRELYVGVLGNYRLQAFPARQLFFDASEDPDNEFYTQSAKFDDNYRERHKIATDRAEIAPEKDAEAQKLAKKVFRLLQFNGYARIDLRLTQEGHLYVLEANPNPDIARYDEFADGAEALKIDYPSLLTKVLNLGLAWHKDRFI